MCVEVVLEERSRQLRCEISDTDGARWLAGISELDSPTGLHLFHFLVDGRRTLSSAHPIFGDSNAILCSEALRKCLYLRSRDRPLGPGTSCTKSVQGSPRKNGKVAHARSFAPAIQDGQVEVNGQSVASNIARPWSVAFNLASMGNNEDEILESASSIGKSFFVPEVYDGLYDAELRLRLDGHMLPEVKAVNPQYRLWAGASLLKKKVGVCEDAYFVDEHSLGVADGVGCMVQFASYGINAAAYASELMSCGLDALRKGGPAAVGDVEERAAVAVASAENEVQVYGASTIIILVLDGAAVGVANLGDSGFLLLRKTMHGFSVVKRSEEQQHSWNCPYQLTRLPPALVSKFPKVSLDKASDCETYSFDVEEGDLLLVFSDGLHDNLHEKEILHIVDCALPPAFGNLVGLADHSTPPDVIARSLAKAAQERSLDPVAKVPFVDYSRRHGYQCLGGKQDDITVLAAWVMPDQPDGHKRIGWS